MFKKAIKILPKLVIATAVVPVVTVLICLSITKILGHVSDLYVLPQISLTGNHPPERWIYLLGFGSTSIMMLFMVTILHTEIMPLFMRRSCLNGFCYVLAILYSLGLLTQSVFCLQEDFASSMSSSITAEELLSWLETTTVLHLLGAGVFFTCALIYVITMVIALFFSVREVPKSIPDEYINPFGGFWYKWKVICLFAYIFFFLMSDFGGNLFSDISTRIFVGAFGQWSSVLSFIVFCFSFSFDIKRFITLNPHFFGDENIDPSVPSAMNSDDSTDSKMVMLDTVKSDKSDSGSILSSSGNKKPKNKEQGAEIEKKSLIANDSMFTIDDGDDDDDDVPIDDGIKPEDLL